VCRVCVFVVCVCVVCAGVACVQCACVNTEAQRKGDKMELYECKVPIFFQKKVNVNLK
jgi:hypothetical protein